MSGTNESKNTLFPLFSKGQCYHNDKNTVIAMCVLDSNYFKGVILSSKEVPYGKGDIAVNGIWNAHQEKIEL